MVYSGNTASASLCSEKEQMQLIVGAQVHETFAAGLMKYSIQW